MITSVGIADVHHYGLYNTSFWPLFFPPHLLSSTLSLSYPLFSSPRSTLLIVHDVFHKLDHHSYWQRMYADHSLFSPLSRNITGFKAVWCCVIHYLFSFGTGLPNRTGNTLGKKHKETLRWGKLTTVCCVIHLWQNHSQDLPHRMNHPGFFIRHYCQAKRASWVIKGS